MEGCTVYTNCLISWLYPLAVQNFFSIFSSNPSRVSQNQHFATNISNYSDVLSHTIEEIISHFSDICKKMKLESTTNKVTNTNFFVTLPFCTQKQIIAKLAGYIWGISWFFICFGQQYINKMLILSYEISRRCASCLACSVPDVTR